jgi:thiamine transporter
MRSQRVLILVEIALTIALSAVLSLLAVRLPINIAGGTVSFAMLPILVLSLRRGIVPGVIAGIAFGAIDYQIEPYFVAWQQVILDYGVAFAAVGLAGLGSPFYRAALKTSAARAFLLSVPWIILGGLGRFAAAWTSGVIFFGMNAPKGQPVWLYSIVYNLSYIVPSIVLCITAASLVLPALEAAVPAESPLPEAAEHTRRIALLVAAAPLAGSAELVTALARDADLIVAVDGGAETCREAGVTPSVLLGDLDSVSEATRRFFEDEGVPIVTFPAEKDETDFELALRHAREHGATAVVATAASSGRLDHTLASIGALARAHDLAPELIEPDAHGWVLSARGRRTLTLTGEGATVSILALAEDAVVSVTGARWPLDRHRLKPGSGLGMSNVVAGETGLTATVHQGVAVVIAERVGGDMAVSFGGSEMRREYT